MIEIKVRGREPAARTYWGICNVCRTTLTCNQSDGELVDDPREQQTFVKLDCPVCKRTMFAYEQKRPDWLDSPS